MPARFRSLRADGAELRWADLAAVRDGLDQGTLLPDELLFDSWAGRWLLAHNCELVADRTRPDPGSAQLRSVATPRATVGAAVDPERVAAGAGRQPRPATARPAPTAKPLPWRAMTVGALVVAYLLWQAIRNDAATATTLGAPPAQTGAASPAVADTSSPFAEYASDGAPTAGPTTSAPFADRPSRYWTGNRRSDLDEWIESERTELAEQEGRIRALDFALSSTEDRNERLLRQIRDIETRSRLGELATWERSEYDNLISQQNALVDDSEILLAERRSLAEEYDDAVNEVNDSIAVYNSLR
jgi:hypothetical protein